MEHPYIQSFPSLEQRSSISSSINPPIQIGNFRDSDDLKTCGCEKPAKERTSWKYHNPRRRFWNCRNSLVDSKENFAKLISFRKKVVELELLLSKEKLVVDKLEKKVTKEKEVVMILNYKLETSMQQNSMLKVLVVMILLIVALWCFK
uniref:Uncharacterized protein n=1 Tax=Lactuca sativa TaxID=4236 RepID=A0A9R1VSE4_LACSA|nr:hypothetical protein LSAT_V11C400183630 [Lactuca sativa]